MTIKNNIFFNIIHVYYENYSGAISYKDLFTTPLIKSRFWRRLGARSEHFFTYKPSTPHDYHFPRALFFPKFQFDINLRILINCEKIQNYETTFNGIWNLDKNWQNLLFKTFPLPSTKNEKYVIIKKLLPNHIHIIQNPD